MSVMTIFEKIAENAAEINSVQECDYMGSDGLIYCGKCHTPKQSWSPVPLSDKKWAAPVPCVCMEAKFKYLDKLKSDVVSVFLMMKWRNGVSLTTTEEVTIMPCRLYGIMQIILKK